MEDAKTILARWSEMESARAPWDASWQLAADFALPRKASINRTEYGPGSNAANRLYDTTAIEGTTTLANGHSSHITPAGTRWFNWAAPDRLDSDRANAWYAEKAAIAIKLLSGTNFQTTLDEAYLDRSGFGIANIAAMPSVDKVISFQAHPVGSFCIDEDSDGNVDTIFLKKTWGIRQICQYFGEEVVMKNKKLGESWAKFKEKGTNCEHVVINAVFPRIKREAGKMDIFNMPFASVWIAADDKGSMLKRSGDFELPYCVTRYLKRSGSGQQYGYSPFEEVQAAIRDANLLRQVANVIAQRLGVPSILQPDDMVGNIDTRPGGKTVFNSKSGTLPQEWLNKGKLEGILEQLEDCRRTIRGAYHTDLFRMFAQLDKAMTAREVAERSAEKLGMFGPSFSRFTADFQTLMARIFGILWRAGVFGKPEELPQEVLVRNRDGALELPPPKVIYQSRIALALQQAENAAADRMLERALPVSQLAPQLLDNIDLDSWLRVAARNDGVPEAMLRKEDARDKMREARAAKEAEDAKLQQAALAAKAAGDLSKATAP